MPAAILLAILGMWVVLQAIAGGLGDVLTRLGTGTLSANVATRTSERVASRRSLETWNGATLSATAMPGYRAMIQAAAGDGVALTPGSTYRTEAQQIALRRQACGPTSFCTPSR